MPSNTIIRAGHTVRIKGCPLTFVITDIDSKDVATVLHIGGNYHRVEEKVPCCCLLLLNV